MPRSGISKAVQWQLLASANAYAPQAISSRSLGVEKRLAERISNLEAVRQRNATRSTGVNSNAGFRRFRRTCVAEEGRTALHLQNAGM